MCQFCQLKIVGSVGFFKMMCSKPVQTKKREKLTMLGSNVSWVCAPTVSLCCAPDPTVYGTWRRPPTVDPRDKFSNGTRPFGVRRSRRVKNTERKPSPPQTTDLKDRGPVLKAEGPFFLLCSVDLSFNAFQSILASLVGSLPVAALLERTPLLKLRCIRTKESQGSKYLLEKVFVVVLEGPNTF